MKLLLIVTRSPTKFEEYKIVPCLVSREERCGRRTNPVKSTCTSTTPQLSERAGADACISTVHSKIDSSELAAKGGYAAWGGRLLSVLSRRRDFQKPDLIDVLFALLQGEAQILGGVLELAYCRAAGDGQAFPTKFIGTAIGRCSRLCLVV